ncbi:MAG: hypothetical protein IPK81_15760 [Rhodospirillales bacterium]|nr:MAG: hypothetical protein IPK81_15760 [Rhodospirillales bacterium]
MTRPGRAARVAARSPAGDTGTAERRRHDAVVDERVPEEGRGVVRARVQRAHPLDRYLGRGEIDQRQHDAGMALAYLAERACFGARVTQRYAPRIASTSGAGWRETTPGGAALSARAELRRRLALVGPIGADILWHVCVVGDAAGSWGGQTVRRAGDGMVLLRAALETIAEIDRPPDRAARPRAWQAALAA